jgi:hypothetical protein
LFRQFVRKEDKKDEVKIQVQPSQEVVPLTQIRDIMEKNSGDGNGSQTYQQQPQGHHRKVRR